MDVAANAVFRSIQGHEVYARGGLQHIDGRHEVGIYTCGVGNQSHTFALQTLKFLLR